MGDTELKVPTTDSRDHAHAVNRAALASVPIVGAAASELFTSLVTPPIERRKSE